MKRRIVNRKGRGFADVLRKVGSIAAPIATKFAKDVIIPKAIDYGKNKILPAGLSYAKGKMPWLGQLGLGRRKPRRGRGFFDVIKKIGNVAAPIAKKVATDIVIPAAVNIGKKTITDYAKQKAPWLAQAGLGRRKTKTTLQAQRMRNLAKARAALAAKRGNKTTGTGFFSDFADGFRKGFTGVAKIAAPIAGLIPQTRALAPALGVIGSLGGSVRRDGYWKAMSAANTRSGLPTAVNARLINGTGRRKLRTRATTAARKRRVAIRRAVRGQPAIVGMSGVGLRLPGYGLRF